MFNMQPFFLCNSCEMTVLLYNIECIVNSGGGKVNVNAEWEYGRGLEHSGWPKCTLGEQHNGASNSGPEDPSGVFCQPTRVMLLLRAVTIKP